MREGWKDGDTVWGTRGLGPEKHQQSLTTKADLVKTIPTPRGHPRVPDVGEADTGGDVRSLNRGMFSTSRVCYPPEVREARQTGPREF